MYATACLFENSRDLVLHNWISHSDRFPDFAALSALDGRHGSNRAIGGGDMRFDRLTASLPQQQTAEKGLVGAIALQHMERTIHFPEPNRFKQIGKAVKCL